MSSLPLGDIFEVSTYDARRAGDEVLVGVGLATASAPTMTGRAGRAMDSGTGEREAGTAEAALLGPQVEAECRHVVDKGHHLGGAGLP